MKIKEAQTMLLLTIVSSLMSSPISKPSVSQMKIIPQSKKEKIKLNTLHHNQI